MALDCDTSKLADLKITDLCAELDKRNIDRSGLKAVLVEKLQKALKEEGHDPDTFIFSHPKASTPAREGRLLESGDLETLDGEDDEKDDKNNTVEKDSSKVEEEEQSKVEEVEKSEPNEEECKDTETKDEGKTDSEEKEEEKPNDEKASKEEERSEEEDNVENPKKDGVQDDKEQTNKKMDPPEKKIPTPLNRLTTKKAETAATEEPAKGEIPVETNITLDNDHINLTIGEDEEKLLAEEEETHNKTVGKDEMKSCRSNSSGGRQTSAGSSTADAGNESKEEKLDRKSGANDKETCPSDDKPKCERTSCGSVTRNLLVRGLSSFTTVDDLKSIFSKHGRIASANIIKNTKTSGSYYYGYMTMSSSDDAERCVRKLHLSELYGRLISVEKATGETFCPTMKTGTSQPVRQESTEKLSSLKVKRQNLTTAQRKAAIQAKLLERGEAFDPAKFQRGKKKKNKKPRMGETPGTHTKEQTFCATMQSKTSQPEIQESTEMPEDAKEKLSSLPVKRLNLTTAQRKAAIQAKLLERGEAFDPAKFKRGKKKKNKKPRMGETPGSNATGETSCSANKTEMSRPESTKKDEKSSSFSYRKENKEGKLCPPGTGEQEPKVYGGVGGGEPGNEEKKKNEEKKTRDAAKRWKERSSDSHSLQGWRDHHSSSQQRSSRQVFSLSKIKEEKERLRSRERTRDSRDEDRRKRNEMKEEAARLERERMLLKREKEKIEQDRAELLRMERERQKLEMERLQREREELEQQQLNTLRKLEEERRGTKRMADDIYAHDSHTEWQRTESYDGKRSGSSNLRSAKEPRRTESHRSSYNLLTQPTPTVGCSSRYHDDYRSSTRGETHDFRSSMRGETHDYRSSTRGDTHDYRSSTRGDTHDYRSASSSGGDSRLVAPSRPSPWSRDDYRYHRHSYTITRFDSTD